MLLKADIRPDIINGRMRHLSKRKKISPENSKYIKDLWLHFPVTFRNKIPNPIEKNSQKHT